jgi:hypothetical protein
LFENIIWYQEVTPDTTEKRFLCSGNLSYGGGYARRSLRFSDRFPYFSEKENGGLKPSATKKSQTGMSDLPWKPLPALSLERRRGKVKFLLPKNIFMIYL